MTDQAKNAVAKAPKPSVQTGAKLAALVPTDLDGTFRLANALSQAGEMVPAHFRNRPEAALAAILTGMEIGLTAMQSLNSIAVINGRSCLWGDAIPALMQRAGHHIDVEIQGEGDNACAVATLERGDTGRKVVRTFSMADAKIAGLLGKNGPWKTYPKRMLSHRARAWAARDGAADAMMGLQVVEEMQDVPMRDVTPKPSGFAQMAERARLEAAGGRGDPDNTIDGDAEEGTTEHPSAQDGEEAQEGRSPQDETPPAPTEDEADSGAEDDSDAEDGPRDLFHVDEDSKEFLDGKAAGEAGFDKSDCPHKSDASKAATWVAGWEAA